MIKCVCLGDCRRKSRSLLPSLSFLTRKRHPFADHSTPQVVLGSHPDILLKRSWRQRTGPISGASSSISASCLGASLAAFARKQSREGGYGTSKVRKMWSERHISSSLTATHSHKRRISMLARRGGVTIPDFRTATPSYLASIDLRLLRHIRLEYLKTFMSRL